MITLIAAADKNNLIGNQGKIPWNNKEDMAFFKRTTLNHCLVMGDITYDSIGRSLPERINYVATLNKERSFPGAIAINDIRKFLDIWKDKEEELFVIGGATIYKIAIEYANRILLSRIPGDYHGDCYFPVISNQFELVKEQDMVTFKLEIYEVKHD